MIVKIAAWLYIINAALTLSSWSFSPFGLGGSTNAAVLMMGGLSAAMGVGLLQQKSWARWLALGSSFLGWTLGALALVVIVGYLLLSGGVAQYFGLLFSGGFMAALVAIVLVFLVLWLVGVVISFKLFFYLCSQEGCDEFGVTYGSTGTVAASAGAWVGIFIVNGMMTGGSSLSGLAARSALASEDDSDRERRQQEQLAQLREAREREQRQRREEEMRARGAEEMVPVVEAAPQPIEPQPIEPQPVEPQTFEPQTEIQKVPAVQTEDDDKPSTKRILKCRDASGAVTFTQGYCPSGTKQVEMPASE